MDSSQVHDTNICSLFLVAGYVTSFLVGGGFVEQLRSQHGGKKRGGVDVEHAPHAIARQAR